MTALALESIGTSETAVPRRPRLAVLGMVLALVGCAFGVSSFAPREPAARAAVPISVDLREAMATMSTGTDQPLVVTGASAVERNALIPMSALPVGTMRGFTQIGMDSAGYAGALKCMTQAIYYEAANEPEAGKRAVAQVVLNRLRHPAYPNSVCGVVYEGSNKRVCQFSFTCDGSLLRTPMARQWNESRRVAALMLAGGTEPAVGTATNYHADYVVPRWAFTLGKLAQIGRHIFYRLPGRIGSEGAFSDRWTGSEAIPTLNWDRLRTALAAREDDGAATELVAAPEAAFVPGLTVVPDAKDRHAAADVGGRLDTRTAWRMTIPDPAAISSSYRSTVSGHTGEAPRAPATVADAPPPAASTESGA